MAFVSSRTATVTTSAETSGPASPARGCGTNALGPTHWDQRTRTHALGHAHTRAHERSDTRWHTRILQRHATSPSVNGRGWRIPPSCSRHHRLSPSCSHRHALQQAHGHVTALSPAAAARRQRLLLPSSRRRQAQGCGWRRHARPNAVPGSRTHGACTRSRARGPAWRCSR